MLGLSTSTLVILFSFLAIILLLVFAFIFMGILAFGMGGQFESVINSMLPIGAGASVGKKIEEEEDEKKIEKIESIVVEVESII